ncbi:MAG: HD domain-containing protein [Acidobacteriota bacterium]|nr:HD domain-containing protein [Acidobacteriota bacterium]
MQQPGETASHKPERRRLSARFDEALLLATRLHREQLRKASGVPYVAHLLAVAALVLEEGAEEDVAIAALLHDAAEDQGGEATLAAIDEAFGADVARWVRQASDTLERPKPSWTQRKHHHLAAIPGADREARLIMLADKVHNARSILADHRRVGREMWTRFNAGREGMVWYYQSLTVVFDRALAPILYDELVSCVLLMQELD